MRKLLGLLGLLLLIGSCTTTTQHKKGNVIITGTIDGLKQGTLYLQHIRDTALITIDSVIVDGDPNFTMYATVTEPEIHYVYLDKNDGIKYNDRIGFFAEKGEIQLHTTLKDFEKDAKITGGKNQEKYHEYQQMLEKFNIRNLKLIKETYEASKQNDDEKILANDKASKTLLKKKYLYTINFALNNSKLEVAPYVALQEVFDANTTYLDTIITSLSPKVKKSIYGKQLIEFVEDRKLKEQ